MSLIETMIALVVLSVGILAMLAAQITALQQGNQGRHRTEAGQVARDQMEFLQRLPWNHLAVQASAGWKPVRQVALDVNGAGVQVFAEQSFDLDYRVLPGATADLRRVDVRVQWTEDTDSGTSSTKEYVMSSLKVNQ